MDFIFTLIGATLRISTPILFAALGETIIEHAPVSFTKEARITTEGEYRFYVGLRSEPFFADPSGFFNDFQWSGQDFWVGKNVFSIALDICTEQAFLFAAKEMAKRRKNESFTLPILPIVLGGDDLTVVCDGRDALQFTHDFLTQFENETARTNHELVEAIIPQIAGEAFTPKRLSASAGVAIIKPHFPFSAAYDLAEELIVSAKRVKKLVKDPDPTKLLWPCSTLDFHALTMPAAAGGLPALR